MNGDSFREREEHQETSQGATSPLFLTLPRYSLEIVDTLLSHCGKHGWREDTRCTCLLASEYGNTSPV